MKNRLHYFFQLKKKNIHALYALNIIFVFLRMLFVSFYVIFGGDRLDNYTHKSDYSFEENVIQRVVASVHFVAYYAFCFFSTKYIDFALYVKVWMIGYQVHNKFENMSYLITRSCFYQDDTQDSDSSATNYGDVSEYDSQSIIEHIENDSKSTLGVPLTFENETSEDKT